MIDRASKRSMTMSIFILSVLCSTGCGFILTHAPPDDHAQLDSFSCTESNGGPIVDFVWAGLNLLGALTIAANPDDYPNEGETVAIGLSWAALGTAAGAVGVGKTKKCREAKQALAARQRQGQGPTPQGADTVVQAVRIAPLAGMLSVGDQLQFVATPFNSRGVEVSGKAFSWSSSNEAIASVSRAGLVTARAPGTVVVAANTQNVVGTANITVKALLRDPN